VIHPATAAQEGRAQCSARVCSNGTCSRTDGLARVAALSQPSAATARRPCVTAAPLWATARSIHPDGSGHGCAAGDRTDGAVGQARSWTRTSGSATGARPLRSAWRRHLVGWFTAVVVLTGYSRGTRGYVRSRGGGALKARHVPRGTQGVPVGVAPDCCTHFQVGRDRQAAAGPDGQRHQEPLELDHTAQNDEAGRCGHTNKRRAGGRAAGPSPGADVGGVSPVPQQMWATDQTCRRARFGRPCTYVCALAAARMECTHSKMCGTVTTSSRGPGSPPPRLLRGWLVQGILKDDAMLLRGDSAEGSDGADLDLADDVPPALPRRALLSSSPAVRPSASALVRASATPVRASATLSGPVPSPACRAPVRQPARSSSARALVRPSAPRRGAGLSGNGPKWRWA
jgi:hypothetical protein